VKKPGIKSAKRNPRPAPLVRAELHRLLQTSPDFILTAPLPKAEPEGPSRFVRLVRSVGARLLRYRVGKA
jgi:hypothetical protein